MVMLDAFQRIQARIPFSICFCQAKKYPFDNRKMTHLSSFV